MVLIRNTGQIELRFLDFVKYDGFFQTCNGSSRINSDIPKCLKGPTSNVIIVKCTISNSRHAFFLSGQEVYEAITGVSSADSWKPRRKGAPAAAGETVSITRHWAVAGKCNNKYLNIERLFKDSFLNGNLMPYTSGQTTYAFCSLLLFRSFFTNSPLARSRFKERFFIRFFCIWR